MIIVLCIIFLINIFVQNVQTKMDCPSTVQALKKFKTNSIEGRWFENYRSQSNSYESDGRCVSSDFTQDQYSFLIQFIRQISNKTRFQTEIIGNATVNREECGKDDCGKLVMGYPSQTSNHTVTYPFWILYADDPGLVIWSCRPDHYQNLWLFSRFPTPPQGTIDQLMNVVKKNKLESVELIKTDNKHCPGYP